jgi:hypothetical protein
MFLRLKHNNITIKGSTMNVINLKDHLVKLNRVNNPDITDENKITPELNLELLRKVSNISNDELNQSIKFINSLNNTLRELQYTYYRLLKDLKVINLSIFRFSNSHEDVTKGDIETLYNLTSNLLKEFNLKYNNTIEFLKSMDKYTYDPRDKDTISKKSYISELIEINSELLTKLDKELYYDDTVLERYPILKVILDSNFILNLNGFKLKDLYMIFNKIQKLSPILLTEYEMLKNSNSSNKFITELLQVIEHKIYLETIRVNLNKLYNFNDNLNKKYSINDLFTNIKSTTTIEDKYILHRNESLVTFNLYTLLEVQYHGNHIIHDVIDNIYDLDSYNRLNQLTYFNIKYLSNLIEDTIIYNYHIYSSNSELLKYLYGNRITI